MLMGASSSIADAAASKAPPMFLFVSSPALTPSLIAALELLSTELTEIGVPDRLPPMASNTSSSGSSATTCAAFEAAAERRRLDRGVGSASPSTVNATASGMAVDEAVNADDLSSELGPTEGDSTWLERVRRFESD